MRKLLSLLMMVVIATAASAQLRPHPAAPTPAPAVSGRSVSGFVTAVNGPLIQLANGLVTIDTSGVTSNGINGPTTIHVGDLVFAVLKPGDVAANAPLPAAFIGVTSLPAVSLSGPVTSVDATNGTITLLGRSIRVTSSTVLAGMYPNSTLKLSDIVAGEVVSVDAAVVNGVLTATTIHVFAPVQMPATIIHGTVKSISNTAWVITRGSSDVTVTVNAQTKIAGSPKVGDAVDVIVTTDTASNYVALSIIPTRIPEPPSTQVHLRGIVKSISPTVWTLGPEGGFDAIPLDLRLLIDPSTKFIGDPKVGDRVDALVQVGFAGYSAISITKL